MNTIDDEIGNRLVQAIEAIILRAEKQPSESDDLQSFVPVVDFDTLSTPNTQIIFGRNGTGKTHLLRAFHKYCQKNFEQKKVLPIYIDCKDLDLGPVMPSVSLDDLILRFYRRFLHNVIKQLKEFADTKLTVPILQRAFGGEAANQKKNINAEIESLYALLNLEDIEDMVKEYVRKVEVAREGSSKIGGEAGVRGELSISKPSLKVSSDISISAEEVEKDKETIEWVFRGLSVIDYEKIREGLERVIMLSGAQAIIILTDEWSSVSLSIQPILAEMIRKTLAISKNIFLKIVALKYFTRTSAIVESKQRIGLQSGIDISVLADLDMLLNIAVDSQGVKDFLTHVAYSHTTLLLPDLRKHTIADFDDYLCRDIFESPKAYFEVVRASEGNPRDFLNILSTCCTIAKQNQSAGKPAEKLTSAQAVQAATQHFLVNKAPVVVQNDPAAYALFELLFEAVVENRQKLFLITAKKAAADPRIQELWHHRFIHLVDPNLVVMDKKSRPRSYAVYSMDYGKLLSIKADKQGKKLIDKMMGYMDVIMSLPMFSVGPVKIGISLDQIWMNVPEENRRKLHQIVGARIVAKQGIETEGLDKIGYLVERCVVDRLLSVDVATA